MDNPGEILRLCRLCLVKDQVNIPIFAEQGDSREIFLKISSCLPVKVSIEDRLPKKICDGCSEKLNSFYEFWSSSANAEKTLLSWLGEDEVEEKKVQAVPKSLTASATLVKEESAELVDEAHAESIEESTKDESEAPPTKRARRSAAVKAQINLAPDSEDDDLDTTEPLTKMEEESADSDGEEKDPSYTEMPGTSADDEQAGPSGMGKDGVEAPVRRFDTVIPMEKLQFGCAFCQQTFRSRNMAVAHQRQRHKDETIECAACSKPVPLGRMKGHMTTHRTRKHYRNAISKICNVCGAAVMNLSRHLTTHRNDREFQCAQCDKRFKLAWGAKKHSICHGGEARHKCATCGKAFKVAYNLKVHMRSHDSVKPFACLICQKSFTTKQSRDVHLKIHDRMTFDS